MPAPKVRSKDQAQQHLRDHKREWNSVYKDFSQKLKSFKDGLNGRGNAKIGLPPSNIKEPFPAEIGSFLNQLAGEFQQIVSDAGSIISEQDQYSKTRRKRKPKVPPVQTQPIQQPTPQAEEKAAEQLARLGNAQYTLEKDATSKLSRFWQYVSAIFSSKRFNKQRIGLLRQAADVYYSLRDFEESVLTTGINNIPDMVSKHVQLKYTFNMFMGTFEGVVEMLARSAESKATSQVKEQELIQPPKPEQQNKPQTEPTTPNITPSLEKIKTDLHLLFNNGFAKQQIIELNELFKEYKEEDDPHLKAMWENRIKEFYQKIMNSLINEVQKRYGPVNVRSAEDIVNLVRKNVKAESISEYMVKNAGAVSRFLKRKLIQLAPSSKTATVRLEIIEIVDEMKNIITKIMDVLEHTTIEQESSLEEIKKLIETLGEDFLKIKRPVHVLNVYYMKDFFSKKQKEIHKGKGKGAPPITGDEEMMDYILKRKLQRELSRDIT
jgi:hypothetical protein